MILLAAIAYSGCAQSGFTKGYVITHSNDTLFGEVKDRSGIPHILFSKVKFRAENGAKKLAFSAKDIKAYAKGSDSFEAVSCDENDVFFAKVIHRGFLTLYKSEVDGGMLLLKKQDSPCVTEIDDTGFKNQMLGYFNDCHVIQDKIKSGEVSNDQIVDLVSIYNQNCNAK